MTIPHWPENLNRLLHFTQGSAQSVGIKRLRVQKLITDLMPGLAQIHLIKVSGTNGKGSVCAMLQSALNHDCKKVGVFTSPHLFKVNERIRLDGELISDLHLDQLAAELLPQLQAFEQNHTSLYKPSFFEALLILALRYFVRNGADFAIIEAGIGGYSDAVSLFPSVISTITSVGLDHVEELGDTLEAIAQDKAGIATCHTSLILGPDIPSELAQVIRSEREQDGVEVICTYRNFVQTKSLTIDGTVLNCDGIDIQLKLLGDHQISNFVTVVAMIRTLVLKGLVKSCEALLGVEEACWPGRLEYVPGTPAMVYDVAHNHQAFEALGHSIAPLIDYSKRVVLFGASEGKDYHSYRHLLSELAPQLYLVEGFYKSLATQELASVLSAQGQFTSIQSAMKELTSTEFHDKVILVVGSIYLVGAVKACLH